MMQYQGVDLNAQLPGDVWMIQAEEKVRHEKSFHSLNPISNKISGEQAKKFFMRSNLPTPILGQIWSLSDLDQDGRMTLQEFMIAMHIIENKLKGIEIPKVLPPSIIYSSSNVSSQQTSFIQPASNSQGNFSPHNIGLLQPMALSGVGQPMALSDIAQPLVPSQNKLSSTPSSGMMLPLNTMNAAFQPSSSATPLYFTNYAFQPVQPSNTLFSQQLPNTGFPNQPASSIFSRNYQSGGSNPTGFSAQPFMPQQTFSMPQDNFPQKIDPFSTLSDGLSDFKLKDTNSLKRNQSITNVESTDAVSAQNRMKYSQIFKAADSLQTGYLTGDQARLILIQSGVEPNILKQIWELSDIDTDGRLELEEFIIAMHLINLTKMNIPLPNTLPPSLIPTHMKNRFPESLNRRPSVSEQQQSIASFEDRRKMNWEKGQSELERRRNELQEKERKEREERERKERELEEQKIKMREEAERKRLESLENERIQKEQLEKEQEMLRKQMIEQRQAAQLEAERQRQREWENRKMEEMLNQKGLEENIVKELKSRLLLLKENLTTQTASFESISTSYTMKKNKGIELQSAIEMLNQSKDLRIKDISRLQAQLQLSKKELSSLIEERERFTLELHNKDSTQTSEAVGAIRSSIQQMKLGVTRLRKNLQSIESETATVLKEASQINEKQKTLANSLLEKKQLQRDLKLQHDQQVSNQNRAAELNREKLETQRRQEELKKRLAENLTAKQKEAKLEAFPNTGLLQSFQKQNVGNLSEGNEIKKTLSNPKVPPARPKEKPQASPVKQPNLDFSAQLKLSENDASESIYSSITDFDQVVSSSTSAENFFEASSYRNNSIKTPPLRPVPPNKKDREKLGKKDDDKKETLKKLSQKNDAARIEQERIEKERMEKERMEKERMEKERVEKERIERERSERERVKRERIERERVEKEKVERERIKRESAERERIEQEKTEREKTEREKTEREKIERENKKKLQSEKDSIEEEEKKMKQIEMKKKIEEMRNKRSEKKKVSVATPEKPEKSQATVNQYVKRTPYKLMFAFEKRNPDELNLQEGDIVQVDESDKTVPIGWLRGSFKGAEGLFPANYASKVQSDTFSDYVDLDPRANVLAVNNNSQKTTSIPNQNGETKESIPKLKPVLKQSETKPAGNRPKTALLPTVGTLKPLQPLATNTENPDLFPLYDFVVGSPQKANADSDLYASPIKIKNKTEISNSIVESTTEDIYQTPGTAVAASENFGEKVQAVALYLYRAKKEDHLSFDKGDIISVQQQQDQWWFGECQGQSGWFPKSYVKPISTETNSSPSNEKSVTIANPNKNTSEEKAVTVPSTVEKNCIALFSYSGQEGDLTFSEGDMIVILNQDGEWWNGYCNGAIGMFPGNYVQIEESKATDSDKRELASVITKYTAANNYEVSLNVGQLVHIHFMNPGGWWKGEVQIRGKTKPIGWFPSDNVKLKSKGDVKSQPKNLSQTPTKVSQVNDSTEEDMYSVPVKKKDQYKQVLAVFSYTAQNEDELTFCKGSMINVLSKDGEWWKGELDGQIGVFPYNYVQELQTDLSTSQWSGSFDSTLLKSMSSAERQRQNHIYELINTEQDYMNDLSLTLEVFYNPMAESKMLNEHELHTVFINWKELIMCNMKFLKAMLVRKKMSSTDKIEAIGDILIEQLPHFSPYIRFCSCMSKACRLLQDKVERDPEFKQFEKKCAGDSRLKQNLSLSSYLLKPLQRITKYPLIILGILKYTPEDHYDRANLLVSHEKAEELCSQVNEAVRSQENSNRLEWLQERVNLEGLEENLVFNSQTNCLGQRKYLFHGILYKHKSNKELRVFLFNDFLLLCRLQTTHFQSKPLLTVFHPDSGMQFTIYKKAIFLNEIIVKLPSDPEVNDTLFHLSHIDRVYSFRAANKIERNTWVNKIQQASQIFIETERDKRSKVSRARSVCDSNEVGRLIVTIMEGADLQASDPTGTSDPYCEVSMGSQEHKTKVIPKDLNPKWNSTMVFSVKDLEKDVLCISVFDRDFFSPNDFLGRTEVTVASILNHGNGPITKRLLLHEVDTGEIVVTLELKNLKML